MSPEQADKMARILRQVDHPRLVGGEEEIVLPDAIFKLLCEIVGAMREGHTILLFPEDQEVTTQRGAEILGVSRPHLIKLIEAGNIPYRKVGSHRRITLKALLDFGKSRDIERRKTLKGLFDGIAEEGAYE